jgi:hypothetical protein
MAAPVGATWVVLAYKPAFLIPAMSLVGVLLAGAVVIALVRRRFRLGEARPEAGDELTRYRVLYEQGAISEKEYHSLRALLAGELRQSVGGAKTPRPAPDATRTTPDTSPGRDLPNTPSDGIRPAE